MLIPDKSDDWVNAPRRGSILTSGISLEDMRSCMGDDCDKNDIDNMEMRQAPACFFQSVSRRNQTTFLPNDFGFGTSQESRTSFTYYIKHLEDHSLSRFFK